MLKKIIFDIDTKNIIDFVDCNTILNGLNSSYGTVCSECVGTEYHISEISQANDIVISFQNQLEQRQQDLYSFVQFLNTNYENLNLQLNDTELQAEVKLRNAGVSWAHVQLLEDLYAKVKVSWQI